MEAFYLKDVRNLKHITGGIVSVCYDVSFLKLIHTFRLNFVSEGGVYAKVVGRTKF
jgi:hypothetical protein